MKDYILILIGIKLYHTFLIRSNYFFSFFFFQIQRKLIHIPIVANIKFVSLKIIMLNDTLS